MRFPRFFAVLAASLFLPAIAAYADTINTLELIGTYTYGSQVYTASGTITIDATTGVVEGIDLSYAGLPSANFGAGTLYVYDASPAYPFTQIEESWQGPDRTEAPDYDVLLPVATLVGYDGGEICSLANPCYASSDPYDDTSTLSFLRTSNDFIDGSLSPAPEPSSLTLFATGALSIAGIMRRKLCRA